MANKRNNGRKENYKGRKDRNSYGPDCKSGRKTCDAPGKEGKYDEAALRGKTKASNDPGWYGTDSVLMKDAANLSFAQTSGLEYNLANDKAAAQAHVFPGIMAFYTIPTPGLAGSWDDPVNVAIRDMYSEIRRANSGAKNYDAANLAMYLQAYDAACTYYAWMVRAYGILRTVIPQNRYTPENLCTAMRVNYVDLTENMAQFRAYINTYAARLFALKIPSKWHVIERHMWLYSNIFKDGVTNKAQFYLFNPYQFWMYELGTTPETTGMFLDNPGDWDSPDLTTYFEITDFGNRLLNSVLNDEDFNIMSGDIIKTYGDKVFTLRMIDENYFVEPIFDPEVLVQIHNASILVNVADKDKNPFEFALCDWSITEDMSETANVGSLKFNAKVPFDITNGEESGGINMQNGSIVLNKFLDLPIDNPSPTVVCIATRLQVAGQLHDGASNTVDNENNYIDLTAYGTEIIYRALMFSRDSSTSQYPDAPVVNGLKVLDVVTSYSAWADNHFAERPIHVRIGSATINQVQGKPVMACNYTVQGPVDNYTVLNNQTLFNIHRAALLGMYEMTK